MTISPWYVGQTAPTLSLAFRTDAGEPLSLAGATLTLIIHNTRSLLDQAGMGNFTITSALTGQATYIFAAVDVATPGTYQLIFKVTVASQTYICDPIPWHVLTI